MKSCVLALSGLLLMAPLSAQTVQCTIDGTGATPKLTFGAAADCVFTGKNGYYRLLARRAPKFLIASCWRDGGGGDATACTTALVRESQDKKAFRIGTYAYPGAGPAATSSAWVSVTYQY